MKFRYADEINPALLFGKRSFAAGRRVVDVSAEVLERVGGTAGVRRVGEGLLVWSKS